MIEQKKENVYYKFYNKKILKYLSKYRKNYDNDTINQLRNDIFIKLYSNKEKIPQKENELDKYIYITCRNFILNYKRSLKNNLKYTEDNDFLENSLFINNIEDNFINLEHYNLKFKKMGITKFNIINYKNQGYSLNEISKMMNIPKTNLYREFKTIKENENI